VAAAVFTTTEWKDCGDGALSSVDVDKDNPIGCVWALLASLCCCACLGVATGKADNAGCDRHFVSP
jgi:hypothetical protein